MNATAGSPAQTPPVVALVSSGRAAEVEVVSRLGDALRTRGRSVRVLRGDSPELDSPTAFDGVLSVVLLAPSWPSGVAAGRPRAFRAVDRWWSEEVPRLVALARVGGCRRVVLQSSTLLYADAGAKHVDETSPLGITAVTEPLCAAELATTSFADVCRTAVVLRTAPLATPQVLDWLHAGSARAAHGGVDAGWTSTLGVDAAVDALTRALECPTGIYNVAEPAVRRAGIVAGRAARGRGLRAHLSPRHLPGARVEPFARSLRVDSDAFARTTGWSPEVTTAASA